MLASRYQWSRMLIKPVICDNFNSVRILKLRVSRREVEGRKVRQNGLIPGVAYRRDKNVKVQIPIKDFVKVAKKASSSQIFQLESDDPDLNNQLALIRDIQIDFIKKQPLHFDLFLVLENEKVELEVPLRFVGEPKGVKLEGGLLNILKHSMVVRCFPTNIPEYIEIAINDLGVGDAFHVEDLTLPEGIEAVDDPEEPIVTVVSSTEDLEVSSETGPSQT